ncbi:phosphoribosyl transferase [Myxococcus sp. K15C18031901]|uniref:phosphoribosyltransferase n=1 Tax=Myxococcus dinghuensis TaxID=2906761 RepID=UPI0020A74712|nr:phosphoribosyltransferase family protein [Myxococcus dinghuensis]MCP3102566.1 phosphoribosyl transferase [Myxococcus dinghuensis]
MRFRDRAAAGRRLASMLLPYRGSDVRVLGLARGGLRVGFEVARALEVPMDVWVSHRVLIPGRMTVVGGVSEGGGRYVDERALRLAALPRVEVLSMARSELDEVERQVQRLRGQAPPDLRGTTVLLIDEGVVTGATGAAALRALRTMHPGKLVLGTPVSTPRGLEVLRAEADSVVCVETWEALRTVSEAYDDYRPLPDVELRNLLERSRLPPWRARAVVEATDPGGSWM